MKSPPKLLMTLLLLGLMSCAELPMTKPLRVMPLSDKIVIYIEDEKVTHCGATYINSLDLQIQQSGEWAGTISFLNTDKHYRPYWHNVITLEFFNTEKEAIASLSILNENIKGATTGKRDLSGEWSFSPVNFEQLKAGTVKITHKCKGFFPEKESRS